METSNKCLICGQETNPFLKSWDGAIRRLENGTHPECLEERIRADDKARKPDDKFLKASARRKGPSVDWDDTPGLRMSRGSKLPRPKLPWTFKGLTFLPKSGRATKNRCGKKECECGARTMRALERISGERWRDPTQARGFYSPPNTRTQTRPGEA